MSAAAASPLVLRDVTLRDGLQDEAPVPTAAKVELFEALVAAGIRDLELTSFVRGDRVPAMADADEVVAATAGHERDVTRWGLVLNERGAQRALAAGLRHLQAVISVSDAHHRHNAGHGVDEAVAALARIVELATAEGAVVELTLGFLVDLSRGVSRAATAYHQGRKPEIKVGRQLAGDETRVVVPRRDQPRHAKRLHDDFRTASASRERVVLQHAGGIQQHVAGVPCHPLRA